MRDTEHIYPEELFAKIMLKDRHYGLKSVYEKHEQHITCLSVFNKWTYGWEPFTIRGIAYGVYFHIPPDPCLQNVPDYELCEKTLDRIQHRNYTRIYRPGFPEGWC